MNPNLQKYLEKLSSDGFYGSVQLIFKGRVVERLLLEQSVLADRLDSNPISTKEKPRNGNNNYR
jgi:hypothetical protein